MSAETEYLFRHALVRTAAYSLQLPGDRAKLHAWALDCLEQELTPDQLDSHVLELTEHASFAAEVDATFSPRHLALLKRAEGWTNTNYRLHDRLWINADIANHPLATESERATARVARAHSLRLLGRNEEAVSELEPALTTSDRAVLAAARNQLAGVYLRSGRLDDAKQMFQLALEDSPDDHTRARLLANIALVEFELNELEQSSSSLARARSIADASGDNDLLALVLTNEARMLFHAAKLDAAKSTYLKALELLGGDGNRNARAGLTANLAELLRMSGSPDATAQFETALKLVHEVGERVLEMHTLGNYGLLMHSLKRLPEAKDRLEESMAIAVELGDELSVGYALSNLSGVLADMGDAGGADDSLRRALVIAERQGDNRLMAGALMERGNRRSSLADLERALELAADELQRQQIELAIKDLHAARNA